MPASPLTARASLLKTNYVSRQDYDTARTQLNEAEANVTVAKAAVEQATINLQYANVTSPITGVSGEIVGDRRRTRYR